MGYIVSELFSVSKTNLLFLIMPLELFDMKGGRGEAAPSESISSRSMQVPVLV